jgi:hypothetical protein
MRPPSFELAVLVALSFQYLPSIAALVDKRIECFITSPKPRPSTQLSRPSSSIYLTNATKPFAVSGAALPYVNFDIRESYAGLLPTGDDEDNDYFFWFVPSTDPVAQGEILI